MTPIPRSVSSLVGPDALAAPPPSPARLALPVLASVAAGGLVLLATLVMALLALAGECDVAALGIGLVVLGPTTVCLSVAMAWTCVRKWRDPSDVKGMCVIRGGAAGALNAPAIVLVVGVFSGGGPGEVLVVLVLGAIAGVIVGGPLGLLFGAIFIPPIGHGCRHDSSLEHGDREAATCAGWLAVVCGVSAVLSTLVFALLARDDGGAAVLAVLTAPASVLAAVGALRARARLAERRAWLDRVRRGEIQGWSVMRPADAPDTARDLRPLLSGRDRTGDILARHDFHPAAGAYRDGTLTTLVATV